MKGRKRPSSFQPHRRYIMKHLLILIIMALSTASFAAATKTEIIEEEVCHAVAGCWVNPKNGECPDCVIETRTIVTVIEDEKIEKVEKVKSHYTFPINEKKVVNAAISKRCFFPKLGWPKEDGTMSGAFRDCDWRDRGKKRSS